MLPPTLAKVLQWLESQSSPTQAQKDLTREIRQVSDAIDRDIRANKLIFESLETPRQRTFAAWGANPEKCHVCGK